MERVAGQRLEGAELRARVVDLRRQRYSFREIAVAVGRNVATVHEQYQAACKEIVAPAVHEYRQEMLDQLDQAEQAVLKVLNGVHVTAQNGKIVCWEDDDGRLVPLADNGPILDAARTLVSLQDRKAKLLGADAPKQVTHDVQLNYTVGGGVNVEALS